MLTHTARGALQMLLSLPVKTRKGRWVLFLLEERMQLSTSTTSETRNESVPLFWFCLPVAFSCELLLLNYLLWEEGSELSCSEETRQRLPLCEMLELSRVLFVKNKSLESFSRILGDPLYLDWVNMVLLLMFYHIFTLSCLCSLVFTHDCGQPSSIRLTTEKVFVFLAQS